MTYIIKDVWPDEEDGHDIERDVWHFLEMIGMAN